VVVPVPVLINDREIWSGSGEGYHTLSSRGTDLSRNRTVTEQMCWIFYNAHRDHPNRAYEFLISMKTIATTNHMSLIHDDIIDTVKGNHLGVLHLTEGITA
jgi:hypothetical protein